MASELDFKVVIGQKDGKTHQQKLESTNAEALMRKRIGETVSGDALGFPGYEFQITGGSDNAGFPLRKGILAARKRILAQKGVGISGKTRNKNKQKGLYRRRTVSGEMISTGTSQINMKVTKVGPNPLGGAPAAEEKPEAAPKAE
ncbi:30S ribosomal protein S6e [archaeon]|jgi:small subunit ribosomal protein S6e|nr:30S ribosomal protein S6e [archaeon]MBT6698285.1 30S ribosomal protein S6e [archaeon]